MVFVMRLAFDHWLRLQEMDKKTNWICKNHSHAHERVSNRIALHCITLLLAF
jgi:hypothetical protein